MSLKKIKTFFENHEFSDEEIRIGEGEVITNQKKYVDSQIKILELHTGNIAYVPYYDRLERYYNIIKDGK